MANVDIKAALKAAGLSEDDYKGKSTKELIKLISQTFKEAEAEIDLEAQQSCIENYEQKLPQLSELLKEPFELFVKEVGQKKSATPVKVVGFNSETSEIIAYHNEKYYQIKETEIIKSRDELGNILSLKPTRGGGRKKKT